MRNVTTTTTITSKNPRAQTELTNVPKKPSQKLGQAESPITIGSLPIREYDDPEWVNHRL
ncbi:hypothetical protein OAG73_00105 [bacterium]|nr:hypothetical protein [bacterium]